MPIRLAASALVAACWLACAVAQAAAPGLGRARSPAQAAAEIPSYAPVKERICNDCALPHPGFKLPRHAVVVGSWSFFKDGTDFQVLDFDSGTLVQAFVPSPSVPILRKPKGTRTTVALPKSALPQLVDLANRLWAEPQPILSRSATDVSWNLWLIDDKQIRYERGTGLPAGLAAEWMRRINKLLGVNDPDLDENLRGK